MEQQVIITTDLGYGDAGKGTMVDALVHQYDIDLVVRYSGGAQAAHNVVTPSGRHHTFAQFGSGTFRPGTKTYLGPKMLVQPQFLIAEATALQTIGIHTPLSLVHIDKDAPIITPYHQIVNRLKELARGNERHGSCGIGIGETRVDSEDSAIAHLTVGDLLDSNIAEQKLSNIRDSKKAEMLPLLQQCARSKNVIDIWHQFDNPQMFSDAMQVYRTLPDEVTITDKQFLADYLATGKRVVMEASQGTLLDEDYGFFPYVTRGKVRTIHAHELLESIQYHDPAYVLGITRAYAARHGPGPFPTENTWLRNQINEAHNGHGEWQGAFRMGHIDAVATRYAIAVNGHVDGIAVTCIDQLPTDCDFYYADGYMDATTGGIPVRNLPLPEAGNLSQLAHRSEYLMREVSPQYAQVAKNKRPVAETIAELCETDLVATSYGQTRSDKQFFTSKTTRMAA